MSAISRLVEQLSTSQIEFYSVQLLCCIGMCTNTRSKTLWISDCLVSYSFSTSFVCVCVCVCVRRG